MTDNEPAKVKFEPPNWARPYAVFCQCLEIWHIPTARKIKAKYLGIWPKPVELLTLFGSVIDIFTFEEPTAPPEPGVTRWERVLTTEGVKTRIVK